MTADAVGGVDIGGTTTKAVVVGDGSRVLARASVPTPAAAGGAAMVAAAADVLAEANRLAGTACSAVGVGAAGVVDAVRGEIVVASDSFTGWSGFPVVARLEEALGVPVALANDVNAFLVGEVAGGAVRGARDALGIMLGTGVGGALWLGGRLWEGPTGGAGEIGHVPGFGDAPCTCGGRGHLETIASGRAIAARYQAAAGDPGDGVADAAQVAARAHQGDPVAAEVFAAAGRGIARAASMTAGILDVSVVVVGGGVTGAWPLIEPAVASALVEDPPITARPLTIVRSALGADAVALGAASAARARLAAVAASVGRG